MVILDELASDLVSFALMYGASWWERYHASSGASLTLVSAASLDCVCGMLEESAVPERRWTRLISSDY